MEVVKAPNKYKTFRRIVIFLGGVIDQGKAAKWGDRVAEALSEYPILILNPRRDDWDASWECSKDNPKFKEQVDWELDGQDIADIRLYVFGANDKEAAEAKAPITFLELGLYVSQNSFICCPKTFYRKGNIDLVAARHFAPVFENLEDLIVALKTKLDSME